MTGSSDRGRLVSRAELEIELARLTLLVQRAAGHSPASDGIEHAHVDGFATAAAALLARVHPDFEAYALERLRQITLTAGGRARTKLEREPAVSNFTTAGSERTSGDGDAPPRSGHG